MLSEPSLLVEISCLAFGSLLSRSLISLLYISTTETSTVWVPAGFSSTNLKTRESVTLMDAPQINACSKRAAS